MSNTKENIKRGSCPVYKKCGGCQLQNLTYAEQLSFKQKKVEKLLSKFCKADKIIGMNTPIITATRFRQRSGQIKTVK